MGEKINFDESVEVKIQKDGVSVFHNDKEVFFSHFLSSDYAIEDARTEASIIIRNLEKQGKTVYFYLHH